MDDNDNQKTKAHVGSLQDLRVSSNKTMHTWSLGRLWPNPIDEEVKTMPSTSGVETAVLFVRQILSQLDDVARNHMSRPNETPGMKRSREEVKRMDERNGILQYAWLDFEDGDGNTVRREQARLLHAVKTEIRAFSFRDIMESPLMLETFWARQSLLLLDPFCFWLRDQDKVENGYGGQTKWLTNEQFFGLPVERQTLCKAAATRSCLSWDGIGDINDTLLSMVSGILYMPEFKAAALYLQLFPICFRVYYTPTKDHSPGWAELRKVRVNGYVDQGPGEIPGLIHITSRTREGKSYNLLSVVRLRATNEEDDLIRIYKQTGEMLRPNEHLDEEKRGVSPYVRDDWKLGEVGHSYCLLYWRCDVDPIVSEEISVPVKGFEFPPLEVEQVKTGQTEREEPKTPASKSGPGNWPSGFRNAYLGE